MKHNIIKTENYLLLVSDEIDFAHLPLNNSPVLEGVPLLPPLEDEVEEAEEVFKEVLDSETKQVYDKMLLGATEHGFIIGYNKAKEKYKFTEEDIMKAVVFGYRQNGRNGHIDHEEERDFIQSLQQPKMPVAFECEIFEAKDLKSVDEDWRKLGKPKTTTNSQGQTVLVGKYIYW